VRRWLPLLALLVLFAAPPARAWTYGDTLTVIWRPLPNLPSFVRPGDTLMVWADAPSSATGWNASLRFGALVVALGSPGGGYRLDRARWELAFPVPAGLPEEIYDLVLSSAGTSDDTAHHAVKVIPDYRASYYFAQVSDTHLPEHALSSGGSINPADTSGMADFQAVIEDLNLIHPEFIIHTGDFVNEGELEEYLGMYEMGRAQGMIDRLRDPMFVSSGNHDIGGWQQTLPPDGTSRRNWWRYFGWPFLASPPAGDPYHSQDYSFDYGPLHCIGLEAYINNGSYDHYMTGIWGAQSMSAEQMGWLAADVAAVPPGRTKLAFFHYDFGGTLGNGSPAPNFSQFSNPAALGLDGVIWGHNHGVADASAAQRAAHPFNLGIQAVIDGRRTFRVFRVVNGAISPGIMHHGGTTTDSLSQAFSGPNDGTRSLLTATIVNRYGEAWEHARLVFNMVDHDSIYAASGGTVAQAVRQGGMVNVYVDCVLPGNGVVTVVTVSATAPNPAGVAVARVPLRLESPAPNPFRPGSGPLRLRFSLPAASRARVTLYDVAGRRVTTLFDGRADAGAHVLSWDGRSPGGEAAAAGIVLVRLEAGAAAATRKLLIIH
jgi:hypothetical protein